jgi:hypothetical protein
MINDDQIDLDELVKTCERLKKYFIESNYDERKPVEIFLTIYKMSLDFISKDAESSDLAFDANSICNESFNTKEDYAAAKDFIVRHRKGFDKLISDNIDEISHYCSLGNVKYLPTIKNTDSSGGHRTTFYIGLIPISDKINHEVSVKTNIKAQTIETAIEYKVVGLPKTHTWLKPLLNFKVDGGKFYTYILLPILAILTSYSLLIWNYVALSTQSIVYSISILTVLVLLYILLKPIYDAMFKRIAIAPFWLLKLNIPTAQLRSVQTEQKRLNGRYIRAIQLVTYKAKCPICGNDVLIEDGSNTYKGRLVGICDESPREHVFSFDHVTKKGKLIT